MGCAPSKTPKMASAAALLGDPSDMDTCSTSMSWQGNSSVAHEISLPGSTLQQAHSLSGETLQNTPYTTLLVVIIYFFIVWFCDNKVNVLRMACSIAAELLATSSLPKWLRP